jgi:hypothetical protein
MNWTIYQPRTNDIWVVNKHTGVVYHAKNITDAETFRAKLNGEPLHLVQFDKCAKCGKPTDFMESSFERCS